jgi:hypothetical protein
MIYHRFRFGWRQNLNVLICRIFGHKLNEDSSNSSCGRCGLAYEECYYPRDFYIEAGIIKFEKKDEEEKLKYKKREFEREFKIAATDDAGIATRIIDVSVPVFCIDKRDGKILNNKFESEMPSYGMMTQVDQYKSCVPMPKKDEILYLLKGTYDRGCIINLKNLK